MTRERTRRALPTIAVCVALLGVLLVLATNLGDIALGPGQGFRLPTADDDEGVADSPTALLGMPWIRTVLFAAFTASLAVVLLSALFARVLRRWLYFTIGLFGALLLFDFFVERIPDSSTARQDEIAIERVAVAPDDHAPDNWNRVLIALGLSLGTATVAVASSRCVVRWWRGRRVRRQDADLSAEVHRLAQCALAPDSDLDTVVRCYREMLHLLSDRERVPHDALTPREFADRLRDHAVPTNSIDRLTALFELVRYGHRDGQPYVDRARSAFADIAGRSPTSSP
jgi:hypothetical protein